jgi:hypothetical protein
MLMIKMKKVSTITLLLCTLLLTSQAQNSLSTYQRFDATYIFGGQVYKNNFIYKPGFSFQTSFGIRLNESVGIGAGMGYTNMKDVHFMPIFVEAIGCRKNRLSAPTIKMQIGYAPGWDTGDLKPAGYSFRGGFYIDAGLGRKIPVNSEYSLYFHWSYRHQFARTDYEIFGGQDYTEVLNYDMIVISLGLIRHCQ